MRTAFFTLVGFLFFTVVCPMSMGAMSMDMGDMDTMSHMMQTDAADGHAAPCEQCKKEHVEVVASLGSQTEITAPSILAVIFLPSWDLIEPLRIASERVPIFSNGPPIPADTLVGTVILRT